ncbi:MAG: thioesterase family protein [Chlamydiae bacterium]|nr:thioesterase family protein [Chlamydiota bacterium]
MVFAYRLTTRYVETAQDGIIHHSSYIIYYEAARIAYLSSLGFDINNMEQEMILCPVVSLEAHYIKPLRSLEDIVVEVEVDSFSKVRFRIAHQIYRRGEKIAYAISSHCFINNEFKPIPIPAQLIVSFNADQQGNLTKIF